MFKVKQGIIYDLITERWLKLIYVKKYIIIIIGIQSLGRFGHRPELSQSTGIALVRCILGKFLGVVCHCFPPKMNASKIYNAAMAYKTLFYAAL